MNPIAIIDSCFKEKFSIPRQPGIVERATAKIIFNNNEIPKECFQGIEGFSHIWVLFSFHENAGWKPTVRPPRLGGNKRIGVFASRSPFRPNNIGMSVVKLDRVEEKKGVTILHVTGHDFLDKTPVMDIKPYVPYVDCKTKAKGDWTEAELEEIEVVFSDLANEKLQDKPILKDLINDIFKFDPRPAYQDDEEKVYGSKLENFDIQWQVINKNNKKQLIILDIIKL